MMCKGILLAGQVKIELAYGGARMHAACCVCIPHPSDAVPGSMGHKVWEHVQVQEMMAFVEECYNVPNLPPPSSHLAWQHAA